MRKNFLYILPSSLFKSNITSEKLSCFKFVFSFYFKSFFLEMFYG